MSKQMTCWASLTSILTEAYHQAFPRFLCRIVEKKVDNLTHKATYSLKSKRFSATQHLTTFDIIHHDEYFSTLAHQDRLEIEQQYRRELDQPGAYIEELPFELNDNGHLVFKILMLENQTMLTGSATYFIENNPAILSLLKAKDIARIAMAYHEEQQAAIESLNRNQHQPSTISYLK